MNMKKRLLLIEDDRWLGESYVRALKDLFNVDHVENIQTAIEKIDDNVPQVIVADFMLDGQNCLELLHELNSYEDTMKVPVVLCSTLGDDLKRYASQLTHYGVVAICDKAVMTPATLRRTVREAMQQEAVT